MTSMKVMPFSKPATFVHHVTPNGKFLTKSNSFIHSLTQRWQLVDVRLQPLNLCEECYLEQLKKIGMDPNSVSILRREQLPHFLYIQMEYCDNTLRQLMDDGTLFLMKEEQIWRIFRQVVEAVQYLHSQGYIHRDCKPSNIFVLNGIVKLGDFGLGNLQPRK